MRAFSSVPLVALVLAISLSQQQHVALAQGDTGLLGGIGSVANGLVGGVTNSLGLGGVGRMANHLMNGPIGLVNQATRPLGGILGGAGAGGAINGVLGGAGAGAGGAINGVLGGAGGAVGGIVNGALGGVGALGGSALGGGPLGYGPAGYGTPGYGPLGGGVLGGAGSGLSPYGSKFNEVSEHPLSDSVQLSSGVLDGLISGTAAGVGLGGVSRSHLGAAANSAALAGATAAAASGAARGGLVGASLPAAAAAAGASGAALDYGYGAGGIGMGMGRGLVNGALAGAAAANVVANEQVRGAAEVGATLGAAHGLAAAAAAPVAAAAATNAAIAGNVAASGLVNQAAHRQALANDALANAHAESAIAGADMVAHGANNARSASLASNAYRQAKLASARDRVNIAGTIQNSARISDAAIATHDSATKAEDSLLGSEIAVDSAATVLDSDAAYIPPVTNSMLRSLPYGRVGLRNIIPRPLTHPSVLLPDVWLNGRPVNYLNVPFRMLPYGPLGSPTTGPAVAAAAAASGFLPPLLNAAGLPVVAANGQPFLSNNGILINGMVVDPSLAYLSGGLTGVIGSSVFPVLANGQLEAQDEVAAANAITLQQQNGAGSAGTYHGFGRFNSVPMLTGSVTDVSLAPTTTIGTTYPIGSAMVIEPRDSFFQDYVDNASSRQNWDEKHQ